MPAVWLRSTVAGTPIYRKVLTALRNKRRKDRRSHTNPSEIFLSSTLENDFAKLSSSYLHRAIC